MGKWEEKQSKHSWINKKCKLPGIFVLFVIAKSMVKMIPEEVAARGRRSLNPSVIQIQNSECIS